MVHRRDNDRALNGPQFQVIADRDGRPSYAVLPFEAFVTLLTYARKGSAEAADEVMRGRLYDGVGEDDLASMAQLFVGRLDSVKTSLWREHFKSLLTDDRMENTFKEVSEWLLSTREVAAHREGKGEDADDVAAYDAAKAREEESFPAEVADRLIAGERPLKVFREYRGLTQRELAKTAGTSAAYVSQIETAQRTGSVGLLHRLAEALGVGLDDVA
jgi:DNA-binding XRE family transcriptional regulator